MYKVLVQHRNDLDHLLGSLAGGIVVTSSAVSTHTHTQYGELVAL